MKIVVLDGHALDPGDLSWEGLAGLGELDIHPRTPREEVVTRSRGAAVVVTNKAVLDRSAISALGELRLVAVTATGYNVVDLAAAREHGVVVSNVPDYSTSSVAQATFALILELASRVGHHDRLVHEGGWAGYPDFSRADAGLVELCGLTLGIVGFGSIGRSVAHIARAMGMRVLAHTPRPMPAEQADFVDLDTLFCESDVVSLHCPLKPETALLVNGSRLALMKRSAWLINTARGGLVDEAALALALEAGRIAGAAVDVLSTEPPSPENPLLHAPNCVITPHIAWATRAARERLMAATVANVRSFLAGAPTNVVS